jgi:hypothetical protein
MVFEIFGHFLYQGAESPYMVMTCIPSDATRHKKQLYDLGVGMSTIFEKCGHFLFKGGMGPRSGVHYITYIPSDVT